VSQQIGSFVNDEGGLAQSTRLSAGTSSSSAATRIITRLRLSRHGPGVLSLTILTLSLASPASETRHPWRGCEDRAYICACRSTDPLYIVRTAQNHLLVRWIRQTGSHRHAKRSEMHFARRTWHFVPHNHAAPRSPYSLDTVATEPRTHSSAPLLQQPPPCIPHSAYVIILHSQS
jgi:hypothetical protein